MLERNHCFIMQNLECFNKSFNILKAILGKYESNTGHVNTYLNAISMVISNIVMKFNNGVDFFEKFVKWLTCRLLRGKC